MQILVPTSTVHWVSPSSRRSLVAARSWAVHGAVNSCTASGDRNEKQMRNTIWPYFEEGSVFPLVLGPKGSSSSPPYGLVSQITELCFSKYLTGHLSYSLSLLSFYTCCQNQELCRVSLFLFKRALQIDLGTKTHPFAYLLFLLCCRCRTRYTDGL